MSVRTVPGKLLVTLVAAAALTLWPAGASADSRFGINAQVLFWSFPQSTWATAGQEMSQDGIKIVRADASWNAVEPFPPSNGVHSYHWDILDAIETVLASNQIRWLPIVDYSTPWDASQATLTGPDLKSPPADDSQFATYAAALVARYGPNGSFWSAHPTLPAMPVTAVEVWNEENNANFWHPQPNPGAYATLYEQTRSAIHGVNPNVKAIVGGLTNPSTDYLSQVYGVLGGSSGMIDAVSIHPYAQTPNDMYADIADTRSLLDGHGDINVPIDVTEFGWATQRGPFESDPLATDAQRGQYLQQFTQTVAAADCGVESILPHTWMTSEQNSWNAEDWYGLVHVGGIRSASETAYSSTITNLEPLVAPTSSSASVCSRQLGVTGTSSSQQSGLLPGLLNQLRLPYLLPWSGASARASADRPIANAARHGRAHLRRRARSVFGACSNVTVTSSKTPVDHARVTFKLRPQVGVRASRADVVETLSDSRGRAQACWRTATRGSGVVAISAQRWDFPPSAITRLPIRWGPAS